MVKSEKESAVSPVVGVMLMVVITVVVAAVVSLFASGIIGSSPEASDADVEFVGVYTAGFTAANINPGTGTRYFSEAGGLLYKVVGNKPLDLTKLKLDISSDWGGGGYVSLTYDDPVSTAYLPANTETGRAAGSSWSSQSRSRLTPPLYMDGHRIIIYGYGCEDPTLASSADPRMFAETADPGEMFLIVPEYIAPAAKSSSAIGFKLDEPGGTGTLISGGMMLDGGSIATLTNKDTGHIYDSHALIASDMISTAY